MTELLLQHRYFHTPPSTDPTGYSETFLAAEVLSRMKFKGEAGTGD